MMIRLLASSAHSLSQPGHAARRLTAALLLAFGFAAAAPAGAASTAFTVNVGNTDLADKMPGDGVCADINNVCSLRAAIMEANALANSLVGGVPTPHTITFSVATINVINGSLPTIAAPVTITGTPGVTTISGNNSGAGSKQGCISLTDSGSAGLNHGKGATGSKILNMAIGNCSGDGISANGHDYTFSNNRIGVDALGVLLMPNNGHGISVSASQVYPDTSTGFLSSTYAGFPVQPVDASQINAFQSNLATAMANFAPVIISGNVISGNAQHGIFIFSQNLAGVIASGNMIGTDVTGNIAAPNGGSGVFMTGSTFGNLIGPNNVISGNTGDGVRVEAGAVFLPNFVMGNRIGLSSTNAGTHIGNGLSGIVVDTKPSTDPTKFNPSMIGLVIGPANLIADNKGANNNAFPDQLSADSAGIVITGGSTAVKVWGNTVGMGEFPPGTPIASKAYGNAGDGIIVTTTGNSIGGSAAGQGNTVAGNARHGIVVKVSSTTSNSIVGNSIGVHPSLAGNLNIGNGVDGIHINAASSTTIGGAGATDFNVIAGNGRNGVKIRNGGTSNGWSNLLQRNRIYSNSKLVAGVGIDLDHNENMTDPPHSEFPVNYANLDQSAPIICTGPADSGACNGSAAPSSTGGNTTFDWTLATHGPANFRAEFFRIDAASNNAATTMSYLGEQLFTTGANGLPNSGSCVAGRCTATIAAGTGGSYVVMTVSDITPLTDQPGGGSDWKSNLICFIGNQGVILSSCNVNNTSEFSNVINVPTAPPSVTTTAATAITTSTATINGLVTANGASTTVTFEYGLTNAYGGAGSPLPGVPSPVAASAVNTAVSAALAGLTCNTTYHYRVNGNNGVGSTINGADLTFTTAACAAAAPTATTVAADNLGTTTATLNGLVSANGATTTVTFQYGLTVAYTGAGSPVTAPQSPLSSGASNAPVTAALTGLTCNTLYHYRVTANNGVGGTVNGSDMTFTTAPCAPSAPLATTTAATAINATGATLNGTVTANGAATTVTFEYGLTTAYGGLGSPVAATQSPLSSGSSNAPVSVTLTSLSCNTLYHFRVTANNGVGATVNGADQTFTTAPCAPTAATAAATLVTTTTATVNGTVSANGTMTNVSFEYGLTNAYGGAGSPVAATQSPLAANATGVAVSVGLAGLTCNTTYHFRVTANNGVGGTVNGSDMTFTTAICAPVAPTATTTAATALLATTATVNGLVTANGAPTTVTFEYGLTNAYGAAGSPATAAQSPLSSGATNSPVSANLINLVCSTTYHYRVTANNGVGGTVNGSDMTFVTAACPAGAPTVTSAAATAVTATGAVLHGTVTANGGVTTAAFEYGLTASYGGAGSPVVAVENPIAAGAVNSPISATLSGLACNTTYHFRAQANNGVGGTINGGDLTFTTATCATTTVITAHTPDPSTTMQLIAVTATVTPPAPAGTVTVSDGTGASCVITLPATSCNLAPTSAGSKTLTAVFSGTAGYLGSTSAGVAHTVTPVVSFIGSTATGTGTATATVSGAGCTFTAAQFIAVAPLVAPAGVSFPHGLFDFKVGGCGAGATATVQVTYPQAVPAGSQYWKYGPTPGPVAAHWYALAAGAPNNLVMTSTTATFTITDGGLGDDDLTANGVIVDQGGPGAVAVAAAEALPVPTLRDALLLLLAAALMLCAALRLRHANRTEAFTRR